MKMDYERRLEESLDLIKRRTDNQPVSVGIILGSGLGNFAERLREKKKIATSDIPHFPRSTVSGHKGNLVFGRLGNVSVLAAQGRTHFYEGYKIEDVGLIVRIMVRLGVRTLVVTNAAGSVNPRLRPGNLMIIRDHINFMFNNPLRGNQLEGEVRWPDMYNAYDEELSLLLEDIGQQIKIPLRAGVLFTSTGPAYETASEVHMARKFGADAVSMSTVPEVLVARANQMRVVGLSCITNMATGMSQSVLSHSDVEEVAAQVREKFSDVLENFIQSLHRESKEK